MIYESEIQTRSGGTGGLIKTNVEIANIEKRAEVHRQEANQYMESLIQLMKANKADYALFFEYAGENTPNSNIVRRDNTDKKTFWV